MKVLLTFLTLALLLLAVSVLGVAWGPVSLSFGEVLHAIAQGLRGLPTNTIVWDIRLPRVLLALLTGAALGATGASYQGLFRNPLADPYLMGAASGAALGAVCALTLTGNLDAAQSPHLARLASHAVATSAFVGGVVAVLLALWLAGGLARTHDLVLSGVVVGAILTGITTWLMMRDADRVQAVLSFTLGNLALAGWPEVRLVGLYLLLSLPILLLLGRALNVLQLGEDVAASLGLPVPTIKALVLGASTLAVAASVSQAGIIGFVGLIAPHTMRRILGGDHRLLLPAAALAGAVLLVVSDLFARTAIQPAELPAGVVTTLLGGPFFLYLLRSSRAR